VNKNMHKKIALLSITFAFAILFFSGAAAAANPNTGLGVAVNNTNTGNVQYVNTSFNYTTTVTNNKPTGTLAATGVNVKETIPTGINVASYSASTGTFNLANDIWTIGTVNPGDVDTLNLSLIPTGTAAGPRTLSADLYQNPVNGVSTHVGPSNVGIYVDNANVTLTNPIFVSATTANVGTYFYKLLTVTNNGPDGAFSLNIADPIPSTLDIVNAVSSIGFYTVTGNAVIGYTYHWNIPFLASGHSATLQIGVKPNQFAAGTTVTNSATLLNTYQTVYAPGVYVPLANVKITKTASTTAPVALSPYTYTVTAANSGPDAATTVSVKDISSAVLNFISYTASQGTYNAVTGIWTVGTIASGASAWLNLTVSAPLALLGHTVFNTAIESQDQYSALSNQKTAAVNVVPTSLVITKTVSNTTPIVNQSFNYTDTVTNNGAIPATNVRVIDNNPPGSSGKLTYTGYTSTLGTTYNHITGLWTIPNLAVGASAWLNLDYTSTDDATGLNFTDTAYLNQATVSGTTYNYRESASATASVIPKPSAPFVISTGPANGGIGSLNPIISINFNELIAVGSGNIEIKTTNAPGTEVPYTININGSILTLTPSTQLKDDTWYTVILHSGSVVGQNGSAPLAVPYTFRFFAT